MNRIFRLMGVHRTTTRRIGGWVAPAIIAASITAVALAMVLTSTAGAGEKPVPPAPPKAVEQMPEVALLAKKLGVERAAVLYELGKAGASNEVLLAVLHEIETDPDKIKKIEYYVQEKMTKRTKLEVHEAELVKKLKAAGKSDEEIKLALQQLHKKYEAEAAKKKAELAHKEQALIEQMKAEGASKEEIKGAIAKLRAKFQAADRTGGSERRVTYDDAEKKLIAELKAEGASKAQIKEAVAKLRAKRSQEMVAYEKKLIAKMEADGASKKEIQAAITALRKQKGLPPRKSGASDGAREVQLRTQMKAAGLSAEEIDRVLKELQHRKGKEKKTGQTI